MARSSLSPRALTCELARPPSRVTTVCTRWNTIRWDRNTNDHHNSPPPPHAPSSPARRCWVNVCKRGTRSPCSASLGIQMPAANCVIKSGVTRDTAAWPGFCSCILRRMVSLRCAEAPTFNRALYVHSSGSTAAPSLRLSQHKVWQSRNEQHSLPWRCRWPQPRRSLARDKRMLRSANVTWSHALRHQLPQRLMVFCHFLFLRIFAQEILLLLLKLTVFFSTSF